MAYTPPSTVTSSDVLTAALWNTQVKDNLNALYKPPACLVRRTTQQTPFTSGTAVTWEGAIYDTTGPGSPMFSLASPTRVTIQVTGLYLVEAYIIISGTSTITIPTGLPIAVNGTTKFAPLIVVSGLLPSSTQSVATTFSLAAGDYIEARPSSTTGGTLSINGNATNYHLAQSRLSVTWIGSTT